MESSQSELRRWPVLRRLGVPPYGYGAPNQAGYATNGAASANIVYPVGYTNGYYPLQQQQKKPVDPRNEILAGRWAAGSARAAPTASRTS